MRWILFLGLTVVAPISAGAVDLDQMKTLKDTGACVACDLSGGDLRWANVYAAELGGAPNLVGGDLSRANLSGANLYGGNLESAKLMGADLRGADLRWTSLLSADLTGADVTGALFDGAIFCKTIMPDGTENNSRC